MDQEKSARLEQIALRISFVGYAVLAALGVGFAWLTGSEAILFDGVFSIKQ